jgi:hypothetical protein
MPNTLILTNPAARRGDAVDVRHAGQTWKGVLGWWGTMFSGLVAVGVVVPEYSLVLPLARCRREDRVSTIGMRRA